MELSKLLTAAFGLGDGHASPAVVGFEDEAAGVILPISLACSGGLPLESGVSYRLLLTDSDAFLCPSPLSPVAIHAPSQPRDPSPPPLPVAPVAQRPASAGGHGSSKEGKRKTKKEEGAKAGGQQQQQQHQRHHDEEAVRRTEKMRRFIDQLVAQGLLSRDEEGVLQALLDANHVVLIAAYRVAQHRQKNKELLTALWKNIARLVLADRRAVAGGGREGQLTNLEVHEDMLLWLDVLRHEAPGPLTATQLASLEYLVLVQEEAMYDVFARRAETGDKEAFVQALRALAERADELLVASKLEPPPAVPSSSSSGSGGSHRSSHHHHHRHHHHHHRHHGGHHSQQETTSKPPAGRTGAAVPKPLEDVIRSLPSKGNVRPVLVDWLLQQQQAGDEYIEAAYENYLLDRNEEELIDSLQRLLQVRLEALKQQSQQHQRQQQQQATPLGVPKEFMGTTVRAIQQQALTREQGMLLCDLFAKGHEVVRGAWTRYTVEKDGRGLLETLRSIVRIAAAAEKGELREAGGPPGRPQGLATETTPTAVHKPKRNATAQLSTTRQAIMTQSLELLLSRKLIASPGIRLLSQLFEEGSQVLKETLDEFLADQDVEGLLERLLRILGAGGAASLPPSIDVRSRTLMPPPPPREPPLPQQCRSTLQGEDDADLQSFASDKAVKCSSASVASFSSLITSDDDRSLDYLHHRQQQPQQQGGAVGRDNASELGDEERGDLLTILFNMGIISEADRLLLTQMLEVQDRMLGKIFTEFQQTQDTKKFQRQLRKYLLLLKAMQSSSNEQQYRKEEKDEEEEVESTAAAATVTSRSRTLSSASSTTLDDDLLLPEHMTPHDHHHAHYYLQAPLQATFGGGSSSGKVESLRGQLEKLRVAAPPSQGNHNHNHNEQSSSGVF